MVMATQVEGLTQGSKCETALKDYFGGVFSNELLADGGRYSERPEPFYYISVPVKDQGTLQQVGSGGGKSSSSSSGSSSYWWWWLRRVVGPIARTQPW